MTAPRPLPKSVITRAAKLGFTPPRVVDLNHVGDAPAQGLAAYIAAGHHGTMAWMKETQDRRSHPQSLWPEAKSAVVVGLNYGPEHDPLADLQQSSKGVISVYAKGRDYHDIIKGRLKELAGLIARDTKADVKVFVDTAPLMEKPLAAAAGLGWQGKHTNLVSRDYGSWLFLGVILSAATLTPDIAEIDNCGSCRACLDICPTGAFPEPYQIDARRCISYLTIEHKGPVDLALRAKMGNRIYGCDDCLAICPWNKFAQESAEIKLKANDPDLPDLAMLAALDDAAFRARFASSPIKRVGRDRFIRNVLYAIGNSGDPSLLSAAKAHLNAPDPVVKDAADWACNQLNKPVKKETS
ncbi:tRNA epoxyqueuosine(34) reductase QueG [Fretibacter rubidus]|uniref:tRNA epoxyqueuosine(34) reductase QueG n=1 Tax=Fretibacter rubidus TaxID=570162 RepID=UPI00352B55F2